MAFNRADRVTTRVPADIQNARRVIPIPMPSGVVTPGGAPFQRSVFPWWQVKPPMAQDFNAQDFQVTLPAGVGSTANTVALSFTMPETSVGVIQTMSLYILSPVAADIVQYMLRINESPVSGWDNKQIVPGAANFVKENWTDIHVIAPQTAKVDMLMINVGGTGPLTVGGQITGWYMSTADIARINGEGY